ncbi:MAG: VOC family protein [Robiginitomaculum sp.]|nr:VOC family protein [Robiginitomaculum sp.]
MVFTKITPVLLANDLEACVEFWKEFGLEATISVPFQDKLGFVSLQGGSIELMYQSFAFSKATNPVGIEGVNRSVIYLEAKSLDQIVKIAEQFEIVIPDHKTSYGSREIYIRDPAGNLIGFAQQGV